MSVVSHNEGFRHEALLYSGWAEFVAGTVPFIREGIEAGEPVLVVESTEKIHMLRTALGRSGDAVLFADMAEVGANPARIIPAWNEFVAKQGRAGRRLRGIGEPIWKGRSADELVECQRHESLLNVAFGRGRPWWLLCPYDAENLDESVLDEARRSHEFVSERGTASRSGMFRGFDASGGPFAVPLPEPGSGVHRLIFGPDDLGVLRSLVGSHSESAGLGTEMAAGFVTAVNEVATNSILHGGGTGTLRLWRQHATLVCEVRDAGRFERPLIDRQRPSTTLSDPRGLWLANQLCDLVQIRNLPDGTAVRLHMRRNPNQHLSVLPDPHPGSAAAN